LTFLRRHFAALLGVLCAGIATLLLLLAFDARTWRTTVARDDLRFRALPDHRALWRPQTLLPGDPASALIGTGDTIAYRRALQYFWFSRVGSNPDLRQDTPTLRAIAQQKLQKLVASAPTARQRSAAANLLGVLVVTTPITGSDQEAIMQILRRAAGYFQTAIGIDPANVDAKENLELVLRVQRPGKGSIGRDARTGYGFGRGRGANVGGAGY
jgi:xanthine/CO dehydrogenase XdhC/CoxF family maturation factor